MSSIITLQAIGQGLGEKGGDLGAARRPEAAATLAQNASRRQFTSVFLPTPLFLRV
jgi:hypothetical protein